MYGMQRHAAAWEARASNAAEINPSHGPREPVARRLPAEAAGVGSSGPEQA
jgi:hypothetical protein